MCNTDEISLVLPSRTIQKADDQTSWTIARIAEEVGFHHITYYSSYFSKKEGISPANSRRKFTCKYI
ncbi:AraC family transcriptional regulator [Paenibacillus antarcticus]|nr:AraC family transcriptional regulator [Paenibacillus antarcticus]